MPFPRSTKSFRMTAVAADDIARLLSRIPSGALAAATKRCRRTVENWLGARTQPNLVDFVMAAREFPELITQVAELAGHKVVTESQLDAVRQALIAMGDR